MTAVTLRYGIPVAAILCLLAAGATFAREAAPEAPAKVTHTTWMDIEIGDDNPPTRGRLWFGLYGSITPKTAANFFKLCQGGFVKSGTSEVLEFNNSVFHRVIPGFMAQGGDFTRHNGTGGKTIFGGPNHDKFDDENFVEKHTKRGLLSMANAGPNTNGSQFFITFEKTPWLDGKHVVFGEVIGDSHMLQKMEAVGSSTGKTNKKIKIVGAGVDVQKGVKGKGDFNVVGDNVEAIPSVAAAA